MARGDLTDAQWERLRPLLPPEPSGKRGHPYADTGYSTSGCRTLLGQRGIKHLNPGT